MTSEAIDGASKFRRLKSAFFSFSSYLVTDAKDAIGFVKIEQ